MPIIHYIMQDLLDQLITHNHACHSCLRSSAMAVADLSLRAQLQNYSKIHEELILELNRLAARLDLSVTHQQMHSLIADMPGRSSFSYAYVAQDRYAILAECQIRLRQALSCYDQILEATLPQVFLDVLAQQAQQIEKAFHHIHWMCQNAQPRFTRRPAHKAATVGNAQQGNTAGSSQDDMLALS